MSFEHICVKGTHCTAYEHEEGCPSRRTPAPTKTEHPDYNADVHNDCTPCPQQKGERCELIGTGLHEGIERHLLAHGWSQDKIDGIRLGGMLSGKGDLEVLNLAHDGILLFSPRT